jgi:hypothetical protein
MSHLMPIRQLDTQSIAQQAQTVLEVVVLLVGLAAYSYAYIDL